MVANRARCGGRRGGQPRLLFSKKKSEKVSALESYSGPFQIPGPIEPGHGGDASVRVRGTTDWLLAHVVKPASKRCSSGSGFSNGQVDCVSSLA
jgi:hypothetical protein